LNFPKRIYTVKEVELARKLIKNGYKHRLSRRNHMGKQICSEKPRGLRKPFNTKSKPHERLY